MNILIAVALAVFAMYYAGVFAKWLFKHDCFVGEHYNGRCGVCGLVVPDYLVGVKINE